MQKVRKDETCWKINKSTKTVKTKQGGKQSCSGQITMLCVKWFFFKKWPWFTQRTMVSMGKTVWCSVKPLCQQSRWRAAAAMINEVLSSSHQRRCQKVLRRVVHFSCKHTDVKETVSQSFFPTGAGMNSRLSGLHTITAALRGTAPGDKRGNLSAVRCRRLLRAGEPTRRPKETDFLNMNNMFEAEARSCVSPTSFKPQAAQLLTDSWSGSGVCRAQSWDPSLPPTSLLWSKGTSDDRQTDCQTLYWSPTTRDQLEEYWLLHTNEAFLSQWKNEEVCGVEGEWFSQKCH